MIISFVEFLQLEFADKREVGGMPITKDNHEDLFDAWLSNLDGEEYIQLAQKWGDEMAKITLGLDKEPADFSGATYIEGTNNER